MYKKLITGILTVALLAGAVFGIRYLNAARPRNVSFSAGENAVIPNETLTVLEGSGYQTVDENEQLRLLVNYDDGNIQVENKANGYIWRSCPTEEEMALENSNTLWKNNLQSPVMFTYTTNASATDTKYTNVYSQETAVTVYALEQGVRVYFQFTESNVTFAYDIHLNGEQLVVDIPSELIHDPGEVYKTSSSGKQTLDKKASCLVVDFYLFPSLGATRSDMGNTGSLFVPDGMGALLNFNSDKYINSQYISHVYGADMALYNGYDTQLDTELSKPSVNFPVFGIIRDGNTLLAVLDEGETQADIVASKAQVQTGFNTVNARFTYRMKYKVITNAATGDGYLSYTSFCVPDNRRLIYYFGTGSYVDMAVTYRGYLMEKYGLNRIDAAADPAAMQLYIVGGDTKTGLAGSSMIPMTTTAQAQEILQYFLDRGITQIDAVYTGWAKNGESVLYPDRFPASGALGGDAGLTALGTFARENGISLYLVDDHMTLNTNKGVSVRRDAVYNVQNNPLFNGSFANAAFMQKNFENCLPQYLKYGIAGLEEQTVCWLLLTDYAATSASTREQMKQAQRALLSDMLAQLGKMRLASCRAFALMDGVTFTYMDSSSYLTILDESVPFYNIALHGLVDYLCGDYQSFYEPRTQLLETIAKGGMVSFTVSMEETQKLTQADSASYYSTTFALWKEEIFSLYQSMLEYLNATRGCYIVSYETPAPGVTVTGYDNGVKVLVNTGSTPVTVQGVLVPAQDFIVWKGGNQGA